MLLSFNQSKKTAMTRFLDCCACRKWAQKMLIHLPFASLDELCEVAESEWFALEQTDWLEVFKTHPQIGEVKSSAQKSVSTTHIRWSRYEQVQLKQSHRLVLAELTKLNQEYLKKFSFIFIVCATGKNAKEMLSILKLRLKNSYQTEIQNAAVEQHKITIIRLKKLIL